MFDLIDDRVRDMIRMPFGDKKLEKRICSIDCPKELVIFLLASRRRFQHCFRHNTLLHEATKGLLDG